MKTNHKHHRRPIMLKKIVTITALVFLPALVYACQDPDNVFAVVFNNGESLDISVIEQMGEEGVSYLKNGIPSGIVMYTFRSHYNQSIMVQVSKNVVNFTIDTTAVKLNQISFGDCIDNELTWLVNAGILAMDHVKRDKIKQSFEKIQTGSYNYWTKEDTLVHSSYIPGDNGVFEPIDCIGSEVAINLPPQILNIKTGIHKAILKMNPSEFKNMNSVIYVDICGRKLAQKQNILPVMSSGILIGYDVSTGLIKRTVSKP